MEQQQKHSPLLPALTNEYGEVYLQGINRTTFRGKHSHTLYRSWFGPDYLQKNSLYIILGTDSGLLVDYFLESEIPPGTRLLFVELDEVITWLNEYKPDLVPENDAISIISDTDFVNDIETLGLENYIYLDTFYVARSFAATDLHYGPYQAMVQNVLQKAETFHWSYKSALSTRPFTVNQLSNLAENHIHVNALDNVFAGKTALLLAGGPSLEKIFPWLEKHRNEVVLLAVSRISKRLQEKGIVPDILFSIDPNPINFNVSKEMFHFAGDTLLVNEFHLYPKLLGQWRGSHVFAGALFPWQSASNPKSPQLSGSTVTNVALEMAIKMGFSTIYLAGVDLCFDQQGFTHARGSLERKAGPLLEGGETTIVTNDGRIAETTFAYKTAAGNIAALAAWGRKEKQTRIINTNPGAASMEGIEYCTPGEIDINPDSIARPGAVQEALLERLDNDTPTGRADHYRLILAELKKARQALKKIEDLSGKALLANKKLFSGSYRDHKFVREMDRIEKQLNSDRFDFIRKLVKTFGIKNFLAIIRPDTEAQWSEQEIEEGGRQYYKAYRKSAQELIALIRESEERIRIRQEEESKSPDYERLISAWQRDGMPGRAEVFKARNQTAWNRADAATRERLAELQEAFNQLITEGIPLARTPLAHLSTWNLQRVKKVRLKLLEFFRNRDRQGLELVVNELAGNEQEIVQPIRLLASGLLHELDGQPGTARQQYQQIIDNGDQADPLILEDALGRICALSLDHGEQENAVLALQCLYDLSPTYGPQYARILELTGRTDDALDVYAEYLGKVPDDINTMLALGRLYRQLNFPDGVAMVVEHVLNKAPDNPQALELRDFCREQPPQKP